MRGFIHSPDTSLIPASLAGTTYPGMVHGVDVYPTLLTASGISGGVPAGPTAVDGIDVWAAVRGGAAAPSPRTEVLYAPLVLLGGAGDTALNPEDCEKWGQACGAAIRVGDFKLIVGYPGDARRLTLPAVEAEAGKLMRADMAMLQMDQEEYDRLAGSGGGPGPDGCHYNIRDGGNGSGCPCHHLNGGRASSMWQQTQRSCMTSAASRRTMRRWRG